MRSSGILLHISSLPSAGGIGTLGEEACRFVDILQNSGTGIWQVLPIGPVGLGGSPYQSPSAFAGNPLLIDLEQLRQEGLLRVDEAERCMSPNEAPVDFSLLTQKRLAALKLAWRRAKARFAVEMARFSAENPWLEDYALYCALTDHFGGRPWTEWKDEAIRRREPQALQRYAAELEETVRFHRFVQFLFFRQWYALKEYANNRGVRIFGDIPIYTAMESADTWAHPDIFQLDECLQPTAIAGVPPDYFSADGQVWENPLYDWKRIKTTGYAWWTQRMREMAKRYDIVRIDHFIGLVRYYAIPAGAVTARSGRYYRGPGRSLLRVLEQQVPGLNIVAEDLGVALPAVRKLLNEFGYPGMRVLEFAFGSDKDNMHLPHNIGPNTVLYTGTHDNDTVLGWWRKAEERERRFAAEYLGATDETQICRTMIEAVFASNADTAIIPMQDFLELGSEARMNTPGTVGGNWTWRMQSGQLTGDLCDTIAALNQKYKRKTG